MPMFSRPDVHTQRESFPALVAVCSPRDELLVVSVPASKNFSISFSSASATISIRASRADSTACGHVGGHRGTR